MYWYGAEQTACLIKRCPLLRGPIYFGGITVTLTLPSHIRQNQVEKVPQIFSGRQQLLVSVPSS